MPPDPFEELQQKMIDALVDSAADSFVKGEVRANKILGLPINFNLIAARAVLATREYRRLLEEKGGSMVTKIDPVSGKAYREFEPWLSNSIAADREEVGKVISESVRDGTPLKEVEKSLDDVFAMREHNAKLTAYQETKQLFNSGTMARFREEELRRGIWHHMDPQPNPREEHQDLDGQEFDLSDPIWNELDLPYCHCWCEPIVPSVLGAGDEDEFGIEEFIGQIEQFGNNCGTGARGFQPGNTCAKGGGGGSSSTTRLPKGKTIKEVAKIAVEHGVADKVFFEGLSADQANEFTQTVADYKDIAPKAFDKIDYIGTLQGEYKDLEYEKNENYVKSLMERKGVSEKTARDFAEVMKGKPHKVNFGTGAATLTDPTLGITAIGVNKNIMNRKDYDTLMLDQVKTGFHPLGGEKFSSHIDHEMAHVIEETYGVNHDPEFLKYHASLSYDSIKGGLSTYATYSRREFVAEAWSEYRNSENPREISKTVSDHIKRIIGGSK